jgi:hypothetical protein
MSPYPADAHDPREECGGDWGAVDEGGALEPRVQPHGVVQAIGCSATLLFILASFQRSTRVSLRHCRRPIGGGVLRATNAERANPAQVIIGVRVDAHTDVRDSVCGGE